jgi:hypothetical protein
MDPSVLWAIAVSALFAGFALGWVVRDVVH